MLHKMHVVIVSVLIAISPPVLADATASAQAAAAQAAQDAQVAQAEKDYERSQTLYKRARTLYDKACTGGDIEACTELGMMLYTGEGGPTNMEQARTIFDKACSNGVAAGCRNLAYMMEHGDGGPQDERLARALYYKACARGDKNGCDLLQDMNKKDQRNQNMHKKDDGNASSQRASAPLCHQEAMITPATMPCGKDWRPWGQWKAKYWCWTDFSYKDPNLGNLGATFCTDGHGTWSTNMFSPCDEKEGWCNSNSDLP